MTLLRPLAGALLLLAACQPPAPPAAPPAPPSHTPTALNVTVASENVDKLADALRHIEGAKTECHSTPATPVPTEEISVVLAVGAVKVWPTTGPAVEIKAPFKLHYSSVSEMLRIRVSVSPDKVDPADKSDRWQQEYYFHRPLRWEEVLPPGVTMFEKN